MTFEKSNQNIQNNTVKILENYNFYDTKITKDSHLFLEIGVDSLSFITLITEIEDTFNINIEIENIGNCFFVKDLVKIVQKKIFK